jgi:branched-subunit amino acid ABC-type transport system permease component
MAAVVGGMTSMPGAVLGALVLGLVQSFSAVYLADVAWVSENLPAPGELAVFTLLLAVLAFRPTGLLGKEA